MQKITLEMPFDRIDVANQQEHDAVVFLLAAWRQLDAAGHTANKQMTIRQQHREITVQVLVSMGAVGVSDQHVPLVKPGSAIDRARRQQGGE